MPFVTWKYQQLTLFKEFIMTLMKLKLNVPFEDLGYRFNVSLSTVSRIFQAWMIVMDVRLRSFIKWPDREDLCHTMQGRSQDFFRWTHIFRNSVGKNKCPPPPPPPPVPRASILHTTPPVPRILVSSLV